MKPPVPDPRAPSRRMRAYNPPLEGRTEKLRLDFNENPIGCSPAVRRALAKLSAAEISAYPEQETVRRKVAQPFRRASRRIAAHQRHRRSAQPDREHVRRAAVTGAARRADLRDVPFLFGTGGRAHCRAALRRIEMRFPWDRSVLDAAGTVSRRACSFSPIRTAPRATCFRWPELRRILDGRASEPWS